MDRTIYYDTTLFQLIHFIGPKHSENLAKKNWRKIVSKYHPDKFEGNKKEAELITKTINQAYTILNDYDQHIDYFEYGRQIPDDSFNIDWNIVDLVLDIFKQDGNAISDEPTQFPIETPCAMEHNIDLEKQQDEKEAREEEIRRQQRAEYEKRLFSETSPLYQPEEIIIIDAPEPTPSTTPEPMEPELTPQPAQQNEQQTTTEENNEGADAIIEEEIRQTEQDKPQEATDNEEHGSLLNTTEQHNETQSTNNSNKRQSTYMAYSDKKKRLYMKEIETILGIQDRKNRGHGLQFKVKWARVKIAPSWESADLLIQEFPEQLAQYISSLGPVVGFSTRLSSVV